MGGIGTSVRDSSCSLLSLMSGERNGISGETEGLEVTGHLEECTSQNIPPKMKRSSRLLSKRDTKAWQ